MICSSCVKMPEMIIRVVIVAVVVFSIMADVVVAIVVIVGTFSRGTSLASKNSSQLKTEASFKSRQGLFRHSSWKARFWFLKKSPSLSSSESKVNASHSGSEAQAFMQSSFMSKFLF